MARTRSTRRGLPTCASVDSMAFGQPPPRRQRLLRIRSAGHLHDMARRLVRVQSADHIDSMTGAGLPIVAGRSAGATDCRSQTQIEIEPAAPSASAAPGVSMTRRALLASALLALTLMAGRGIAETQLSSSLPSLRFLRGGQAAFAPSVTKSLERNPDLAHRNPLARFQSETEKHWNEITGNIAREWDKLGAETMRHWDGLAAETVKLWDGLGENIGREWGKLTLSVGNLFSQNEQQAGEGTKKLDEVLRTFKSVLSNKGEVDTAQLLKACRAHLALVRSGGPALKIVARDMEANLDKAEALFRTLPEGEGRNLSSLLEKERESGVHDGNVLKDPSAAMGLLWIRRSLDFQKDLYASLILSDGKHPSVTAVEAYHRILSPYHGWILQKAFPLSFSTMPDRAVFIAKFGGREVDDINAEYERGITRKLRTLVDTWDPILTSWRGEFERLDLEDKRRA